MCDSKGFVFVTSQGSQLFFLQGAPYRPGVNIHCGEAEENGENTQVC